jgi:hypothetical protein
MSMHPRVENGRTVHELVNTSKPKNKDVLKRKIANVEAYLEEHPGEQFNRKHLEKMKQSL